MNKTGPVRIVQSYNLQIKFIRLRKKGSYNGMPYRNASLLKQSDSWKASKACFLNATLIQCNISKTWCSFGLGSDVTLVRHEGWLNAFLTSKVENESPG